MTKPCWGAMTSTAGRRARICRTAYRKAREWMDKAIELLKGMLQKHPIVKPKHPPFPKKAGFSDGG